LALLRIVVEELMLNFGRKVGILGIVVLAYAVLVPIIPFRYFYNVDQNNPSTIEKACPKGLVYFDAFSRPDAVPLDSANLGVWGVQSITAAFTNFGVVSDGLCAFNPAADIVNGPGLLVVTVPITMVMILGLAVLFLHGCRPKNAHPEASSLTEQTHS
jgi:hypothetical protein